MAFQNLTQLLLQKVKEYDQRAALFSRSADGWQSITWRETGRRIEGIARALLDAGVKPYDRVAIYSQNMPQWTISDYGTMAIRAITTTIYATNSPKEVEYILNDSQASVLFVGSRMQYDNLLEILPDNSYLKKIIVFDDSVGLPEDDRFYHFTDFFKKGLNTQNAKQFQQVLSQASRDDVATIIYTSGTSGEPKGVMLTHANLFSQLDALDPLFNFTENDIELCFLPLSHAYQKSSTHWTLSHGLQVYYCENPKEILEYFKEVRPTFMVGVPRLYEKMYATVYARLEQASGLKSSLFEWALRVGRAYQYKNFAGDKISWSLRFRHQLARKLVLNKIREIMGGRLNFFSAGGAAMAREIEEFFFAAGIFIAQGYGLTETSPVVSCNRMDKFKFGTPGTVVHNCQVKIAEDGEIMVKGDNIMKGYFNKPQLTAEVLSDDGWFKTGDVGHLDEDGFLHITDRKKDIIVTAGGKNLAPQSIESLFGKDYYVEQIAVIGDGHKYITALVVPSFEALEEFAREQGIDFNSYRDLVKNETVIDFYKDRIEQITAPLAQYEKIKKFTLLTEPLSQEKGEITPTLKIKRKALSSHYQYEIEQMYTN